MTAEEFIKERADTFEGAIEAAKEFAKYHVRKALVAAHRTHQIPEEELDFTLNAYTEDEIK
jgi:hypothetical protein